MGLFDVFKKPQVVNNEDNLNKPKVEQDGLSVNDNEAQEGGLAERVDRLGGRIMDEAQLEGENSGKLVELVGDGEDASFLKRLQDTYEVLNHRFENTTNRIGSSLDRAEEKVSQKWAGRALLGLKNIAAIPLQFTSDVIMAGVKSVKNKMTANELSGLLSGEEGPEKLFELMGIDRQSEEGQVIKELLRDEKKKDLALDCIAKSLGRSSQVALTKKTKFTDYLSMDNPEIPKDGQEARTRLEIIYLKNKINPQDHGACQVFEAELQLKDPAKYAELKALNEAVIEIGKKDQPGKTGPWDFSGQGTSLMQKANIALMSAKNGMLWHMLKDPREIAGLATCTINGEYIHNLASFDLNETLKSGKTQDAMMRDLLLLQNIDKFEEPMQKQIEASMKVAGNRTSLLKDQASAGGFTLKNYGKKQLDTMAYLTMRATGGIAMDMFKYATGKHKESVLAAEVGNSGLAEEYTRLLSGLEKTLSDPKEQKRQSMDSANEFGFRLMNLDKGGAVIAVKDLVDKLLIKNSQGGKAQEEELAFLEKMSGFVEYQMSKGRVDIGQVNQVKQLVGRYKMESRSVATLGEDKLTALKEAGYNPSSYASKKTGDWLKDFFIKDEKHAAFVNRNSGNIIFDYLGYQADRFASLGSHQGVEFGGAIALEHYMLENVSGVTTALLNEMPGVGGVMGDMYSAAKAATMTAGKVMSFDFLTGEPLGKPHAIDKSVAPGASQLEALKSQIGQAELFKNLNTAINGEAIVEQINKARESNDQMSEMMVKEVGSFLQAQIPGLTAALAGGAAIMILKNPALLMKTLQGANIKNLGKLLDNPALRSVLPLADDVAIMGFGSTKSAFAAEVDTSKIGKEKVVQSSTSSAKIKANTNPGVTYENFKDRAANPHVETVYNDFSASSQKLAKEQTPVGAEAKAEKSAPDKAQEEVDSGYKINSNFKVTLGKDGVMPHLERMFTMLSLNNSEMKIGKDGQPALNDKVATKALNVAANLVKLAEGKNVASFKADAFKKACTYNAKTGEVDVVDYAALNEIIEKLNDRAEKAWESGELKDVSGAAGRIGDIRGETWLKIGHADGLKDGFVDVDENGKEIAGSKESGVIDGHETLEKDDIAKFQKHEHKVVKKDKVKVESKVSVVDPKPADKKMETPETKNTDDSIIELNDEEYKAFESMKGDEEKLAANDIREAVDTDFSASTDVNIDKIKDMKVSDVLAPDGKNRIVSKLKGPYDDESRANQNTDRQAEGTIKLAQKALEYIDPEEGEKMDSFTKRYQEQKTIEVIGQVQNLGIDGVKVPIKDQVKVLRTYGKTFEQLKDHDHKINLMKVLNNPQDLVAIKELVHWDKLGKDNPDFSAIKFGSLKDGNVEYEFVTKNNMVNVDFHINKDGSLDVDGFGSNNWGLDNAEKGEYKGKKLVTDANLDEAIKFTFQESTGKHRAIDEKEFATKS